MDLLIKNVELPKDGFIRMMLWPDGGVAIEVSPNNYEQLDDNAIAVPPHGELIDRQKAVKRFTKLAEIYDLALKDCDIEKEVYPHYEALMRGKKAVMELAEKLLAECPTVVEASTEGEATE